MISFSKRMFTLVAAGAVFVSTGVASAQQRGPAKHEARMQQRVVEKLGPSLGLDESQSQELASLLKSSGEARRAAMKNVHAEREALRQLVEGKAPAEELNARRARLEAAVAGVPSMLDVLADTGRILDAEQQAKLALKLSGHERGPGAKKWPQRMGKGRRGAKAD